MLQLIRSLYVFLCLLSLFLLSEAQFFDIGAASLSGAPVGFISRVGAFGDEESLASLGNAPVGVYQRRQYPQPWYQVPRIPVVEVHPPVKRPVRPMVIRPPVKPACQKPGSCRDQVVKPVRPVQPPVIRPPVKPSCQKPGSCRDQVVKPVRPVQPPVIRPPVKPACQKPGPCPGQVVKTVRPVRPPPVRPHYKPVVRPPVKPVVITPAVKPGVRPPKRPVAPYITGNPKTHKPDDIRGRNGGLLGGLLGGGLLGGLLG